MIVRSTVLAGVLLAGSAHASYLTYNPSLGTLPQSQGWSSLGTYNAPMAVSGGQLTYGPTTVGGTTFWGHAPTDTINFATETIFIEARIRLTGADFGNFSGFRRGGFSLYLEDDAGRWIIADLGDNRLSLGNDNTRLSDPVATFNLTTEFHTVRLEAGPAGGRLLVDGVPQMTLALGTGAAGGAQGSWGEATTLANANLIEVQHATFIPAPGSLALAGICSLAVARRRRA